MKEFLSRAGHAFLAKNVEEDHDAYRQLMALGVRSVPLTIIGDRRIKGFDAEALAAALTDIGESR